VELTQTILALVYRLQRAIIDEHSRRRRRFRIRAIFLSISGEREKFLRIVSGRFESAPTLTA
jgi:hypothetical protein